MSDATTGELAGSFGASTRIENAGGAVQAVASRGATSQAGTSQGGTTQTAGASASGGEAGATKPPPYEKPIVDITGRWGLFFFEDPVGVQLFQVGNQLTGRGCDVGAPPQDERTTPGLCGDIVGTVRANKAYFGFHFKSYDYMADVTVSPDAKRMTGRFHGTDQWMTEPTAWLRDRDGERFPPGASSQAPPESGSYLLKLLTADVGGTEYVAGRSYRLGYNQGMLFGDLGSFWQTEVVRASTSGPIAVGPVPTTTPELPVSMTIELGSTRFAQVTAVTGSGHTYSFAATPDSP